MGAGTQYTVNNQMVNATLMNIADNPTNVQLPGVYKEETIPRVPIVCTGNDFSTLYAPLIRDGRMEKFYWAPTREDRVGVCTGIFQVCLFCMLLMSRAWQQQAAGSHRQQRMPGCSMLLLARCSLGDRACHRCPGHDACSPAICSCQYII